MPPRKDGGGSKHAFEAMLDAQLQQQVDVARSSVAHQSQSQANAPPGTQEGHPDRYDDVYFDSDDDADADENRRAQRKLRTDEELFYDPDLDDDNQRWLTEQRTANLPFELRAEHQRQAAEHASARRVNQKRAVRAAPESDAILNCPACMTTLCLDCQAHEAYTNQFRAMFVLNCRVDTTQVVQVQEKDASGKRTANAAHAAQSPVQASGAAHMEDDFHPVHCTECNTIVAMYDLDEVYHFFNVLASEP